MNHVIDIFDNDFYKFTMTNFITSHPEYNDLIVKYGIIVRNKEILNKFRQLIKCEEIVRIITDVLYGRNTVSYDDIPICDYLYTKHGMNNYIKKIVHGNNRNLQFSIVGGDQHLIGTYWGKWGDGCLFEIPLMIKFSELFFSKLTLDQNEIDMNLLYQNFRLREKIHYCRQEEKNRKKSIYDFSTRRRLNKEIFQNTLDKLYEEKFFCGTSNIRYGYERNVNVVGTIAHEMFMIPMALDFVNKDHNFTELISIHNKWDKFYKNKLIKCILPDTYGTKFFVEKIFPYLNSKEQYKFIREDSSSNLEKWTKYVINNFPDMDTILFSNSLTLEKIKYIETFFNEYPTTPPIKNVTPFYCWGGDLVNDFYTIQPLDIVIKPISIIPNNSGIEIPVIKLSDTEGKITAPYMSKSDIDEYIKICGHKENTKFFEYYFE